MKYIEMVDEIRRPLMWKINKGEEMKNIFLKGNSKQFVLVLDLDGTLIRISMVCIHIKNSIQAFLRPIYYRVKRHMRSIPLYNYRSPKT